MELLVDILPLVCVAYVAFKAGQHWALFKFSQAIAEDPDEMLSVLNQIKNMDVEPADPDTSLMEIERVGDLVYAYDKKTGQFLAQAANLTLLTEAVNQRFPGKKFFGTISQDNPAKDLVK